MSLVKEETERAVMPDRTLLGRVKEEPECSDSDPTVDYVVKSEMLIGAGWPPDLLIPDGGTVSEGLLPELANCYVNLERLDPDKISHKFKSVNKNLDEPKRSKAQLARTTPTYKDKLTCKVCGDVYPTIRSLSNHERKHSYQIYQCNLCPHTFKLKARYQKHIVKHGQPKVTYVCKFCHKQCNSPSELTKHERVHTGEKPFSCDKCKKSFRHKGTLIAHMKRYTGIDKPYSCDLCQKTFARKEHLGMHSKIHTGEKAYACVICNKRFTQRANLNRHLRYHRGQKPFACDMCDKRYTENKSLKQHKLTHTGEKLYICNYCGKEIALRGNMIIHLRIHSGVKPYDCDKCKKSFSSPYKLRSHELTHAEKKYFCDICQRRFTFKSALNIHFRLHTGENMQYCMQCPMSFLTKGDLNRHNRTHSGLRPFSCDICKRTFTAKHHIVRHLRDNCNKTKKIIKSKSKRNKQ